MPDNSTPSVSWHKEIDPSPSDNPLRRFTSFGSISRNLSTATTVVDDGIGDPKGALGLNLLFSPPEPLIDFIFVHGLGGGSRKTWSKTTSVTHFWPQEWLPRDPAFKNVRIHSFGYDSDWVKGKDNCLNIHHFGKALQGEMGTSPHLGDSDTAIVLIGHSMGGLVIKKAYMLARQDTAYENLAKRIHTIYFIATPHRGSASAKFLTNLLQAAYSSRAYVADLKRSSGAIQAINDEFRNYSADIDLWSFYETQKLKIGLFSTLIVDPDSATLGYREEKQIPMNADHRSICKFETIKDPNYLILRNSLASTVSGIFKNVAKSKERLWRSQVNDLETYLGVSEKPEDDLATAEDTRLPGTCEWLLEKDTYLRWKDFASDSPSVLWITAKPAAGKSVLAGYAVDQIQRTNADCSYFFFKYGEKSKSRLSACLRSLAFQMACANPQIRDTVIEMHNDDIKFDKDNERTIWRKLFLSGILHTEFRPHYWVLDALDECVNSSPLFDLMLAKIDKSIPLRILITSRETPELEQSFRTLGTAQFQSERISISDTLPDIRLLIEGKAKSLVVKSDDDRAALVGKILTKSRGSFLWTVLVLNELSNCYTEEETNQVLEDVPRGMEHLYQRTLEMMAQATRGKKVIRSILTWATCAIRPLTTDELDGALKLEVAGIFLKPEEAIVALCGHMVTVDKFGKVQMVHETAREFLLKETLQSELAIKKTDAHTWIAKTCLIYLTGDEMNPPRSGRLKSAPTATRKRAAFAMYACEAFSYHLSKADPLSNDLVLLVHQFLESNVLSWIEVIALSQSLIPLIRTAKNLRIYLNARAAQRSPLGKHMQSIRGWTTDLIRIVAKFGDALIMSPTAIYSLVLPFCPTESTAYSIAKSGRRVSVSGVSSSRWDDRLACIDFPEGQTSAVCHGDEFFAVGLTTGIVTLYHAISFQEYKVIDHGESVKFLDFKSKSDLLVSCGVKNINIWDIRSGQIIYCFKSPQRPIYLAVEKSLVIVASEKNYLASWDLDNDGAPLPDRTWADSAEHPNTPMRRPPRSISFSAGHKLLAVAYSGQPITLWDLESGMYYGTCGKKLPNGETTTHVVSNLVFKPSFNCILLAVSYLDGELVLIDPLADQVLESIHANCYTLAVSPDGHLLAGGVGSGTIQIYEFDTLRLLYRVKSSNLYIKRIAFSRDSLHFTDIRGSQCNIWEPAVLLRDSVADDNSEISSSSVVEGVAQDSKVKISTMILHPTEEVAFCGKGDGSVSLYDLKTGVQLRTLYRHKSSVRILTWWPKSDNIMSVDSSNCILTWKLKKIQQEGWVAEKVQFQSRLDCGKSIIQVLLNETAGRFILTTRESDHLWSIDGNQQDVRPCPKLPGVRKWIQHPESPGHMICIDGSAARIYTWSDWSEIASLSLNIDTTGLQLRTVDFFISNHKQRILLTLSELDGSAHTRALHLLDATSFSLTRSQATEHTSPPFNATKEAITSIMRSERPDPIIPSQILVSLTSCVAHVVGLRETGKLIFLDKHSWVSSCDLEDAQTGSVSYVRHFFVPYDWLSGTWDLICTVLKRNMLFARQDDVIIVKGGLEHVEMIEKLI